MSMRTFTSHYTQEVDATLQPPGRWMFAERFMFESHRLIRSGGCRAEVLVETLPCAVLVLFHKSAMLKNLLSSAKPLQPSDGDMQRSGVQPQQNLNC